MKRVLAGIVLSLTLSVAAVSQDQTPELLLHAAQCLAAKDFLLPSKATVQNFGYLLDTRSYPGEKVVYVVNYTGKARGMIFAVFLTDREQRRVFNIQNNATFVTTKGEVKFTDTGEALGGVWTHQQLISAIKQIQRQPRFAVPVRDLRKPSPPIVCESYTDKQ